MKWGFDKGIWDSFGAKYPLEYPFESYPHALICGCSGSGKSHSILYELSQFISDSYNLGIKPIVYVCDFKNSEDFQFLKGYPLYYAGNECYEGMEEFYQQFTATRQKGIVDKEQRHLMVFDEYASAVSYYQSQDKLTKGKRASSLIRRYAPDQKYIIVPELHKDKRKWHFHGLFANIGKMSLDFSGKVCIGKYIYDYVQKPFATKIYNIPLWKYGFSTATVIRDPSRASSYITKYVTKDLCRVLPNQHRYLASQNVDKPIERVFNVAYEDLTRIYRKYLGQIAYMSKVKIPDAGQEIIYMELSKEKGNTMPCNIDFSIFEQENQKSIRPAGSRHMADTKQQTRKYIFPEKINLSPTPVSVKRHIQKLRELKSFLKEHPEQKPVYRDINIDFQILQIKRNMMYEEANVLEEDGANSNEFSPAVDAPFP